MRQSTPTEYINLYCIIKHETEKALLIKIEVDYEEWKECWIPISQCKEIHRYRAAAGPDTEGVLDIVSCAKWIAEKNGVA